MMSITCIITNQVSMYIIYSVCVHTDVFCPSGLVCVNWLWNGCRTVWEVFGELCLTLKILLNSRTLQFKCLLLGVFDLCVFWFCIQYPFQDKKLAIHISNVLSKQTWHFSLQPLLFCNPLSLEYTYIQHNCLITN